MRQVAATCYSAVLKPLGCSIDTYCGLNGCVKIDVGERLCDDRRQSASPIWRSLPDSLVYKNKCDKWRQQSDRTVIEPLDYDLWSFGRVVVSVVVMDGGDGWW